MDGLDGILNLPGVRRCSECSLVLYSDDICFIGTTCQNPAKIFFDFECPSCEYKGRWTIEMPEGNDPIDALKTIIRMVESEKNEQRGMIVDRLNKVHGISDLFRLGGKDAPREPRAKKR